MTTEKRAAIYTRQFSEKEILETQIDQCKHYCLNRSYSIDINQLYYEHSTDEQNRPALQRLLDTAKNGLLDVVVITAPGILSSSPSELVTILVQFKNTGVQVETITPSFLDGLLHRPKQTEHKNISLKPHKQKRRSRWTEHAIRGPITEKSQDSDRKRAAIYVRVLAHVGQLKELCNRYGYMINDDHIYTEVQQDNEEYNRPELQRFLESVKSGSIDIVVLKNVQDFSKRPSHLITILNILEKAGVWVETIE